jgi:nitrate/nitrite transporter NarK
MNRLFNQLIPFIMAGMAIVALAFGIMLLAYLFVFGAILGFILFLALWIRDKFFLPKKAVKPKEKSGRIIDSDDWKKL